MKKLMLAGASCMAMAGTAQAGGIDRSGQDIALVFEEGNRVELTYIYTNPNVSGTDIAQLGGLYDPQTRYKDVAKSFGMLRFGAKYDVNDKLSLIFTSGEDYGVDVKYNDFTLGEGASRGSLLGDTYAKADTNTLSFIGRYKFTENFSVHGGIRHQTANGEVGLFGLAYAGVDGYELEMDTNQGVGYLLGAAYEIPDIALRVAVTYFSAIEHNFKTSETLNGASLGSSPSTKVKTPQAVNLDFQTGIAKDTLLFGQIRWVDHEQFTIDPDKFTALTGSGLVDLDNSTTYLIGVGRRFSDSFSASISYVYDDVEGDKLVSPLAPTHGLQAIRLGGKYTINNIELTAGARYSWLGNAQAETADEARADFRNNEAITVGAKIAYKF